MAIKIETIRLGQFRGFVIIYQWEYKWKALTFCSFSKATKAFPFDDLSMDIPFRV